LEGNARKVVLLGITKETTPGEKSQCEVGKRLTEGGKDPNKKCPEGKPFTFVEVREINNERGKNGAYKPGAHPAEKRFG